MPPIVATAEVLIDGIVHVFRNEVNGSVGEHELCPAGMAKLKAGGDVPILIRVHRVPRRRSGRLAVDANIAHVIDRGQWDRRNAP